MARTRGSLLIAAVSGRALARAAVDAGFVPLVADFFADIDTQAIAHGCSKLPGAIEDRLQWRDLKTSLEDLERQAPSPVIGVIYGSGFEDRPHLLAHIATRWQLLGNDAKTVAQLKEPRLFFAALDELAVPHPTTTMERPRETAGWLAKRCGGAGGSHIQPVPQSVPPQNRRTGHYYQAHVPGRTISALFVADGQDACVLGFSEQWTAPAPDKPWRYGGSMQPASIRPDVIAAATETVAKLARSYGLKGLASADFVLSGTVPYLLEVNPRPGATLDIFSGAECPLLALHLAAVIDATLPREQPVFQEGCASAVLYAPEPLMIPAHMAWPSWAADVPHPRERIDKQRPICTVLARAGSALNAKKRVEARQTQLLLATREQACLASEQEKQRRECKGKNEKAEHQYQGRAAGARYHR